MSVLSSFIITRLPIAAFAIALISCSSDENSSSVKDSAPPTDAANEAASPPDAGPEAAVDLYPDLAPPPDFETKEPCESEWIDAVSAVDKVTTGVVASEELGAGAKRTLVDASAGGMQMAKQNPFVYVSLADGKRVDITDLESRKSTDWDMAFRRSVIRINGGDSGPGQGAVAILPGADFETATAPTSPGSYWEDDFLDEDCKVSQDPIGNILTAIGGQSGLWYDYNINEGKLTPLAQIYIIRRADGSLVKLEIESYYAPNGNAARYSFVWSPL